MLFLGSNWLFSFHFMFTRFWLSRAIEGFLRGRASVGDQLFLIKRGLLEVCQFMGFILTSNTIKIIKLVFRLYGKNPSNFFKYCWHSSCWEWGALSKYYCKCWELRIFKKPADEFWNYNLWLMEVKRKSLQVAILMYMLMKSKGKTFSYETSYDTWKNNLFNEAPY